MLLNDKKAVVYGVGGGEALLKEVVFTGLRTDGTVSCNQLAFEFVKLGYLNLFIT